LQPAFSLFLLSSQLTFGNLISKRYCRKNQKLVLSMRKAALIYNPTSGSERQDRISAIEIVARALRAANVEVVLIPTLGRGTAGDQARAAIEDGCDTVVACGGDGTVHEVLQGVVGTSAALGVVPLGTANALACDLGIPRDPRRAAEFLLKCESRRIAAGKIEYCTGSGSQSRYFIVAAGVGADAYLAYALSVEFKRSHGMAAYYAKATQIWAMHDFPHFEVRFTDTSGKGRAERVSEVLAIRITNFGGILRRMAPRAALRRNDLELVLFKTRKRLSYLRFVISNMLGRVARVTDIEFAPATELECVPIEGGAEIDVEADGEALGRVPTRISMVPNAVTLLMRS
jgi:diacylglycerol kinase (ATP)